MSAPPKGTPSPSLRSASGPGRRSRPLRGGSSLVGAIAPARPLGPLYGRLSACAGPPRGLYYGDVEKGRTDRPRYDLDKLTVAQAADALDISQDAVRKRIARGTIPHDRDASGRVYVYLSPYETVYKTDQDATQDDASKTVQDAYVRSLEDQIGFLRRELERKDAILLNLTERIPELEVPQETEEQQSRGSPQPTAPGAQEGARRPWWRRMFGG
jgi:hypothetical protein